jgi:LCP family protein required for cell wall assembly
VTEAAPRADTGYRPHRTWPERLSILVTFATALLCLFVAAALVLGYSVVRTRNVAELENPADLAAASARPVGDLTPLGGPTTVAQTGAVLETTPPGETAVAPTVAGASALEPADPAGPSTEPPVTEAPVTEAPVTAVRPSTTAAAAFPEADPEALNFLVTGADNGACIDPDSPMFDAFGDRAAMGARSDTIMIIRVDPSADRVAVLSFPRDLWVEIADSGNMQRINTAYEDGQPQNLADTIYLNFEIPIDHYIQVDFCAFKELVDAVGGVSVPFEFPARDENTGLLVEEAGCVNLEGDMALAYVRSRKYEYEDPPGSGNWQTDGTSDLGRISRQQDFLRRVLSSLLDKGPLDPGVARGLIRAGTDFIVVDRALTPAKMLEFAGVMNDVDPAAITTYQIEATPRTINGNAVLIPNETENMEAVLGLFRGDISLADAPVQQLAATTAAPSRTTTTIDVTDQATSEPGGSIPAVEETVSTETVSTEAVDSSPTVESTLPNAAPEENQFGIVPPRDLEC